MELKVTQQNLDKVDADWLVIPLLQDESLPAFVAALDETLGGQIGLLRERGDLTCEIGKTLNDPYVPEIAAKRLCIVGLGKRDQLDASAVHQAVSVAAMAISTGAAASIAVALPEAGDRLSAAKVAETVASALIIGSAGPGLYQAKPVRHVFTSITLVASESHDTDEIVGGMNRGQILGDAVNLTRELVNRPAGEVYPETFADRARELAAEVGLECDILDQPRLEAERMGSLLAVAQGSDRPPRVAVLKHLHGGDSQPTIALVGKGVTFDSGGLSIKTGDGMKTMKCDMAGAATVLGVMSAIARLKLPVNVIGLMGLVENMVSGNSYKLGDVLTARNGVTIEVLNTDAEGRLVLADVLSYAVDLGAHRMIDLATLTGACVIALGEDFVGAFTNDEDWCREILAAVKMSGEKIWQMPMHDSFNEQLESDVADCKNVGKRWGGAITAAKFLEKFVSGTPWVHLDIAGPAFAESKTASRESGATGVMVRSLVELLSTAGSGDE